MDRKEYWNKEYADYWRKATLEAEEDGLDSNLKKISGHDFKTPDIAVITGIFDGLLYKKTEKLLDYGCGLGRFYPYFEGKGDYYGIDISQAMIDECRKAYPEMQERFIVAEGENLPFSNDFFDKVVCYGVFDACYQEQALAEMIRITKVGGNLIISGKADNYYPDDDEAYIAEVNARKKGHPNYFTNVREMIAQLTKYVQIENQFYTLKRGDFAQGKFVHSMPERFYEWLLIIKKSSDEQPVFTEFSNVFSKTYLDKQEKSTNDE